MNDCPYNKEPCLYDLDTDPCEYTDIKADKPEILDFLYNMLSEYNDGAVPALKLLYSSEDEAANPENFGGFWSPWRSLKENSSYWKEREQALLVDTDLVQIDGVKEVRSMNVHIAATITFAVFLLGIATGGQHNRFLLKSFFH